MPTLSEIKEATTAPSPLLLFECTMWGGATERWCTHAVTVDGNAYARRVLSHAFFGFSMGADGGMDSGTSVSLTLANADGYFNQATWSGLWRGAKVRVRCVFWDFATNQAVYPPITLFDGIANPPDIRTDRTLRLSVVNRWNATRLYLPEVRLQRSCPWHFPSTAEQRQEALEGGGRGKLSALYRCGYSPDLPGGCGNLIGGIPYTSCDYTAQACRERGMFDRDEANRVTRRFGGFEYVPPTTYVREHGDKSYRVSEPLVRAGRYNDYLPIVYGTAWLSAPIVTARNDGNLLRMEAVLSVGQITEIQRVTVNSVEVGEGVEGADMTSTGWYNLVTSGTREGAFNADLGSTESAPVGDPHGSIAVLSVVAPKSILHGNSLPEVKVLLRGVKVQTYALDGAYLGEVYSNNPAWILLDILRRAGWTEADLDLVSFARTAEYCAAEIPAFERDGSWVMTPRYQCNLVVRNRRSVAELVRGVRAAASLYWNFNDVGQLSLHAESTLALQHPQPREGSNCSSALNGGYPVYEFGDGSNGFGGILLREDGSSSLRFYQKQLADTANRVVVEYQDEAQDYQQDSLSLIDLEDYRRRGHELSVTLPALGIPNRHQAIRVVRLNLDKLTAGNMLAEFDTSFRAVGIRPGDIITITSQADGLSRQPFRVLQVSPSTDFQTARILAQIHDDAWYSDAVEMRAPGWLPGTGVAESPGLPMAIAGRQWDELGNQQFQIEERSYETETGARAIEISVGFNAPPRPAVSGLHSPVISRGASAVAGGGTIPGPQSLYYAVSAVGPEGESRLSAPVRVVVPSTPGGSGVQLDGLGFPEGATGFHVYRGATPLSLLRIAVVSALAGQFLDTGAAAELVCPPDENFDHAVFRWRAELAPPQTATEYGTNFIGCASLGLGENGARGAIVRILAGKGSGQERVVESNTTTRLYTRERWTVQPDATSVFVVSEAAWRDGTRSVSSPATLSLPNRPGAFVQILGTSANARGEESPAGTGVLGRWRIGGGEAGQADVDVPPPPMFGLTAPGNGIIEIGGISFQSLANTRTITAGTLVLHYYDELAGVPAVSLAQSIDATQSVITVNGAVSWHSGDLLQIGAEILVVAQALSGGQSYEVTRASHGSVAAAHPTGAVVYALSRRTVILTFPKLFFGSPASGTYTHSLRLPSARLACADLFMTNAFGNGEASKVSFTATADHGLRTYSGGQFSFQVEGNLAIQTRATPTLTVESPCSVRDVFAMVQEAPTGGSVVARLKMNGSSYCELTIPAGQTISNTVNGAELAPLGELAQLDLDIDSVPQGAGTTPGRDLSVTIRL